MYDKLDFIQEKYQELSLKVSDPDVIADQANWQKFAKELGEIEPIVQKYVEYKNAVDGIKEASLDLNGMTVDGKEIEGNILPLFDGGEHTVIVKRV